MSDLKLDEKVNVINLCDWYVSFNKIETLGDVRISPKGITRISIGEIIAQVHSGNKLFTGVDGLGSHASIYIDDASVRKELEFETDTKEQNILSKDKVKKIFELKTMSAFQRNIREAVVTRAEKALLLSLINELKLNEYDKIVFCQDYCKFKLF